MQRKARAQSPAVDVYRLKQRFFDVRLATRRRASSARVARFSPPNRQRHLVALVAFCFMLTFVSCVNAASRQRVTRRTTSFFSTTTTTTRPPTTIDDAAASRIDSFATNTRPDLLCNENTSYQCVCNRSMGDLDTRFFGCDNFLEAIESHAFCRHFDHICNLERADRDR